jgi:hypothetical protein
MLETSNGKILGSWNLAPMLPLVDGIPLNISSKNTIPSPLRTRACSADHPNQYCWGRVAGCCAERDASKHAPKNEIGRPGPSIEETRAARKNLRTEMGSVYLTVAWPLFKSKRSTSGVA